MKQFEFINKNIGRKVYLTPDSDLAFNGELRKFIIYDVNKFVHGQLYLTIVKITKSGLISLYGDDGQYYSVASENIRLASETESYMRRIDKLEGLVKRLPRDIQELMWRETMSDITHADQINELKDKLLYLIKL